MLYINFSPLYHILRPPLINNKFDKVILKKVDFISVNLTPAKVEGITFMVDQLNSMKNKGFKMKGKYKPFFLFQS